MGKDTGVFRVLEPDGMTSMVFVAVNAEYEFEPVPEDSRNAMFQVCEVLPTSSIYGSGRGAFDLTRTLWCQLFSLYGNMLYSLNMYRILRSLTLMEDFRGITKRMKRFVHERPER